jgi:hypothetical protein
MLGCQRFKEFLSLKAFRLPSLKPTKRITPNRFLPDWDILDVQEVQWGNRFPEDHF